MKKFIIGFLCGAALFGSTTSFAADTYKKIQVFLRDDIKVNTNGTQVKLAKQAITYEGSTYLSVRDLASVFGKEIAWDSSAKTVEIHDYNSETEPSQGSSNQQPEILNDYLPTSSTPAIRVNGVVYLPLREGGEKYDISINYDAQTKSVGFVGTDFKLIISENLDLKKSQDSFVYNGISYMKEKLFAELSEEIAANKPVKSQIGYLEFNKPFISNDNGMTVLMKEIVVSDKGDYKEYTFTYVQSNNTKKEIDEATFKIYFENGESEAQYGFFGKLMPNETLERTYTFKATNDKLGYCLEYGVDTFFSEEPAAEALKWKVATEN